MVNSLKHQSGSMIFGEQEKAPSGYLRQTLTICTLIAQFDADDEICPCRPVWATFNQCQGRKSWSQDGYRDRTQLTMLIQAYTERMNSDAGVEEIVANIYKETKEGVKVLPEGYS